MTLTKLSIVAGAVAALGLAMPVWGQDGDPVAERQALMTSNGQVMRTATRATGDEAIAAAEQLLANFTALPDLFADPDLQGDAQPAVWENMEDFVARFEANQASAQAALDAAEAGDMAAYGSHIQAIGQACGQCHSVYRQ